jgi:acetyltransferase
MKQRSTDVFHKSRHPLDAIFAPHTVAVIGATERPGSVGRTVLWNLIRHPFGGMVFPINPRRSSVLGIKTYPHVADTPEPVDLAVVVTPAATIPDIIQECAEVGVNGAIVISAGFKETGSDGAALEQQLRDRARQGHMRVIGPNCLGVICPPTGLNATFANTMATPGTVAFLSQSGALCTAVLDWSLREHVGFSAFVSVGAMTDVGWGDLIDYLGDDPRTQSIVIYMESVGDARSFLSAAREVALTKPIIVIKAGRTSAAAQAAASHTGALTGSDAVLDAAFRRCGVLRVNTIGDLFCMAEALAKQPRPQGPRLTLVTNAGGPGVLATDALLLAGGALAPLAPETMDALNQALPSHWSHNNPIDIIGDADPERYAQAVEIAAHNPHSDGLLVILTPQGMTSPTAIAERLRSYMRLDRKPVLASWMGGDDVADAEALLNQAGIPTFAYPDDAARAFHAMWRYSKNLRGLYETPTLPTDDETGAPQRAQAQQIIEAARSVGRTILTEVESKQVLSAYGIPIVETRIACSEDEAVADAEALGYPVVLKLWSETITHKTDVGGVQLNLGDAAAVRRAYHVIAVAIRAHAGPDAFVGVTVQPMITHPGYELILGSSVDPQFGPTLLFGAGGQLVEVFEDCALGLPPLTTTLARRIMEQTRIYRALQGVRGRAPVDLAALEQIIVQFSHLIVEQRWIKEIDINPLLAAPEGCLALDARIALFDPATREADLPRPAIRPYPIRYVAGWALRNGTPVTIRPIRPEDEPLIAQFHETLSDWSVEMRYFHPLKLAQRTAHERLTRICFVDYDRELALVAEHTDPRTGDRTILGVGRLRKLRGVNEAEVAIIVSDRWQRHGLGTELLRRLLHVGRAEGLDRLTGLMLSENRAMQRMCRQLGFRLQRTPGDARTMTAIVDLHERQTER